MAPLQALHSCVTSCINEYVSEQMNVNLSNMYYGARPGTRIHNVCVCVWRGGRRASVSLPVRQKAGEVVISQKHVRAHAHECRAEAER